MSSNININGELDIILPNLKNYYTLDYILKLLRYVIVYKEDETFWYAYSLDEYESLQKRKIIRRNLRKILETAIHESIKNYMPVNTIFWKINYTGI